MQSKPHQHIRNPSLARAGALRRIGGIVPGKPSAMSLHTFASPSPAAQARHILVLTAIAWCIAPASPHEVARRAPHGHVPLRVLLGGRPEASTSTSSSAARRRPRPRALPLPSWPTGAVCEWPFAACLLVADPFTASEEIERRSVKFVLEMKDVGSQNLGGFFPSFNL